MTFRRWSKWFATATCGCLASSVFAGDGNIARWATFHGEGSSDLYALSIQADSQAKRTAMNVVVLVDTSASQTGVIRRESLQVVDALLAALPETAKVAVMACDVSTQDLSGGLQSPTSSAITNARAGLDQRVPLGTTNLSVAFEKAQKCFGDNTDGVIVYIGDGVNRTNVLDAGRFDAVVKQLAAKRTSVISLAIGPFYDTALLATLANHSGGMIFIRDNIESSSQEIGTALARAAAAPVLWPEAVTLPNAVEIISHRSSADSRRS